MKSVIVRAAVRIGALVAVAVPAVVPVCAQDLDTGEGDPTRAGAQIRDALSAQLAGLRAIALKGLVVARDGGGVALLEMPGESARLVRSNAHVAAVAAGLPLRATVRDVTPGGVEIEAPTLSGKLVLPAALGPAAAPAGEPGTASLRHAEFRDAPLADALLMLADQGGTNYACSAEAAKVTVTVFLRNVPAHAVVEEICKGHNLWYRQDEPAGILRVMTMAEFERDLVSFREEQSEVFTLLYPNVLEVAAVIRDLYGDRVVLSAGRDGVSDEALDLAQRFQRFDLINQRSQNGVAPSAVSGLDADLVRGIGTAVFTGSGGAVWSGDRGTFRNLTPDQAGQVQRLIAAPVATNGAEAALQAYRQRPASILVTVSRRNNMIVVRTSDPRALEDIRSLVRRLDVPTPLVLLEVKVLSVDLGDGFRSVFDYQFGVAGRTAGGAGLASGGFAAGDVQPPAAGSLSPGGAGLRAGDMTFQVVNEFFRARMQMLEEKNRVVVLATPLLLTANNEVSRLFVGEERPIVRNIASQTILTENNVATAPNTTIEFRSVGTTLLITPNINSDRTVTLRLLQENSAINAGGATIPVVLSGGNLQNVSVDVVSARSISGTFVAKDGLSVAVGGLIEEQKSDARAQVPLLGRIPLLGLLFRRQETGATRRELVILIRPHVISTPSEGEAISRNLLRDLSVHPSLPDARGTLGTFGGREEGRVP